MKKYLALISFLLFIFISQSFSQRTCSVVAHQHAEESQNPQIRQIRQQIEAHTSSYVNSINNGTRADNLGTITIPVVVHVLYRTSAENISDAQIQSQINVINDDFRRTNSDANNNWSQAADTEIEFCMATVDPNGNPTTGITRTQTSTSAFGTNDAMKYSSSGGKDAWNTSDYLNIWICTIGNSILGYAQFPGGSAATDGVVIDSKYFGTTGTAQSPFDLGRTTTHEIGHWLNLRHIWGDGNCSADDYVSDTPTSDAANYGCASGHVSCNSTDMVQNYMDYSDDACMNLFTLGQKDRMRALFATGGFRASLLNSTACGSTPPAATCSDGIQNQGETGVDCGGPCSACSTACSGTTVTVSITLDNYPEETSWNITDASGIILYSGGTYANEADGSTLTGDFCLEDGCYDFTINDSYGDGICCSYGNGSFSVSDANNTLVSGSTFTSSSTTNFCVGGGATATCTDGIQNQGETGTDCGGPCTACASCSDGIQNQGETGTDCGGPCTACASCNAPSGLAAAPTDTDASLSWNTVSSATTYNVRAKAVSATTWSTGNGLSSPVNFTGLTACNDYEFQVQSVCGTETSSWSSSKLFTTTGCSTSSCNDNIQNGNETGVDCGGDCPACATCTDGTQNGNETGIDCGGDCAPCATGCSYVTINSNNFESGYGIWTDGGSDCSRVYSPSYSVDDYSIRLRDNTSTSTTTTGTLNLSAYDEITVDFSYYALSMDNSNEDFWFQVSTDNGASYTTLEEWNTNDEFVNSVRMYDSVVFTGTFTSTMKLRFRCDASGNSDYVYIDNVVISGCLNSSRGTTSENSTLAWNGEENEAASNLNIAKLYPNPTSREININYTTDVDTDVQFTITDIAGKVVYSNNKSVMAGKQNETLDVSQLRNGYYFLILQNEDSRVVKKFIKARN